MKLVVDVTRHPHASGLYLVTCQSYEEAFSRVEEHLGDEHYRMTCRSYSEGIPPEDFVAVLE